MKRITAAALAMLTALSLASCSKTKPDESFTAAPLPEKTQNAAASAIPTATPKAAPTAAPTPTATPTAAPTQLPTPEPAPTEALNPFPTPTKLGNLIGGPLLPDRYKYFVLKGESDLYYIYDNMGELVHVIASGGYYEDRTPVGIYGEYGMIGDFIFKVRGSSTNYQRFADIVLHIEDDELIEIMDAYYENPIPIKQNGLGIGKHGIVLPMNEKYLLINAQYDKENEKMEYGRCVWLDEKGGVIGEFDPSPFGIIYGMLAGKYLICADNAQKCDTLGFRVLTLDGEELASNIAPVSNDYFTRNANYFDTFGWYSASIDCVRSGKDEWLRLDHLGGFVPIEQFPHQTYSREDIYTQPVSLRGRTLVTDRGYGSTGIYAGIKNNKGEWLFKIYDPSLASDSQRTVVPEW